MDVKTNNLTTAIGESGFAAACNSRYKYKLETMTADTAASGVGDAA